MTLLLNQRYLRPFYSYQTRVPSFRLIPARDTADGMLTKRPSFWSLIIASVCAPSKDRIRLANGTLDYESPPLTAELQARAIADSIIFFRFRE